MKKSESFFKEIIKNRKLIYQLSKNDFKTRFAGSYLGIVWAFVQPVITVLVYWFVFQVVFKSGDWNGYPFVLGLMAGLVPWFYFSEAFLSATNSLIEYSYLVKKVVFQINILPIIKIVSSMFVHIFFLAFTIVIFGLNGYFPNLYTLQLIYYLFAMVMFIVGMAYITSALSVFIRDLLQLINVFMQVWMWMTPIMWNADTLLGGNGKVVMLLKLNPLYYIVQGYRDSLMNHIWFWEHPFYTVCYWVFVIGIMFIGTKVFKKLKVHFADVL